jgi:hypothetical protein
MTLRGKDISEGFTGALYVALIGVLALYFGYFSGVSRVLVRGIRPLPSQWHHDTAIAYSIVLIVLGLALYAIYVQQSGGLSVQLQQLQGRSTGDQELADSSSAYFYFGLFLFIPAFVLLFVAGMEQRVAVPLIGAGILVCILLIFTVPRGDRLWMMLVMGPAIVLPYVRVRRRPSLALCLLALVFAFFIGITFLRNVRVQETRTQPVQDELLTVVTDPVSTWKQFTLGPDTEMFAVLAAMVQVVPSELPYHHGVTLTSMFSHWIPRGLWANKPIHADAVLFRYLFPDVWAVTKAGTAPSIFGGFYVDSGYIGLIIGGLCAGVLFRCLYDYFRAHDGVIGVQVFFATALPNVIVLLRGNPTDTFARAWYVLLPLLVGIWLANRHSSVQSPEIKQPSAALRTGVQQMR